METEILHFTTSQEEGLGEEGFGHERREGREGWTGVSVCARIGRVRHGKWGYGSSYMGVYWNIIACY